MGLGPFPVWRGTRIMQKHCFGGAAVQIRATEMKWARSCCRNGVCQTIAKSFGRAPFTGFVGLLACCRRCREKGQFFNYLGVHD